MPFLLPDLPRRSFIRVIPVQKLEERLLMNSAKNWLALSQCLLLLLSHCTSALSAPVCKIQPLPAAEVPVSDDSTDVLFSDLRVDSLSRYSYVQQPHIDSSNLLPQVTLTTVTDEPTASLLTESKLTLPEIFRPATAAVSTKTTTEKRSQTARPVQLKAEPLKISLKFPEGKSETIRQIVVSFTKPMVKSSELGAPAKVYKQVVLSPARAGQWIWADERTLLFKPKAKYLPLATNYKVSIAQSLAALDGSHLAKPESWTIWTPEPRAVETSGGGTAGGEVILLSFTQPVRFSDVVAKTHLIVDGKSIPIRAGTTEEGKRIYGTTFRYGTYQFAMFPLSLKELKTAKTAKVIVEPGIAPIEGTLPTTNKIEYKLTKLPGSETAPLRLAKQDFEPYEPWWFDSRLLDFNSLTPEMIAVEPPLPNMNVYFKDGMMFVSGESKANTNYKLILKAGVKARSSFATADYQATTQDYSIEVKVKGAIARLLNPKESVWLDPKGDGKFPIHSINLRKADISVYATTPKLALDSKNVYQSALLTKTLDLNFERDVCMETMVDLKEILEKNKQLIVRVKNADPPPPKSALQIYQNHPYPICNEYQCWIQSTNLDLSIVSTTNKVLGLVTDRRTGKPVANARVEIDNKMPVYQPKTKSSILNAITNNDGIAEISNFADRVMFNTITASTPDEQVGIAARSAVIVHPLSDNKLQEYRWFTTFEPSIVDRETDVPFFGWVREFSNETFKTPQNCSIKYSVKDAQGQIIATGTTVLSPAGGFRGIVHVPESTSCGTCVLSASLLKSGNVIDSKTEAAAFQIAEPKTEPTTVMEMRNECISNVEKNKQVRTSIQLKTREGNPIANAEIFWHAFLSANNWRPPLWKEFTFSQQLPIDDTLLQKVKLPNYTKVKTDDQGRSSLLTEFKSDLTTPADLYIEATYGETQLQKSVIYTALPSDCFVGIQREIILNGDKQEVRIKYVVCDAYGALVEGRPVKLFIKNAKTGHVLFEKDLVSTSNRETVETSVPGTDAIDVIAEVVDTKNRTHQSNILSQVNNNEPKNQAPIKVSVKVGIEGVSTDKNFAQVNAPFPKGKGFFVASSGEEAKLIPIKTDTGAFVQTFGINKYSSRTEVLAKLYKMDQVHNTPPVVAIGTATIESTNNTGMRDIPGASKTSITLSTNNKRILAGSTVEVTLKAQRADGSPASNAEFVVVGGENDLDSSGIETTFNFMLASRGSEYSQITALSTDRLNAPLTLDEVRRNLIAQASRIRYPYQTTGCGHGGYGARGYGKPSRSIEGVKEYCSEILRTDDSGSSTFIVPVPSNSTNYVLTVLLVSDNNEFGYTKKQLTSEQPLTVDLLKPEYLYGEDKLTLPLVFQNNSSTATPVTVSVKNKTSEVFTTVGNANIPASSNYTLLLEHAEWLGEDFEVKVNTSETERILSVNVKPVFAPVSEKAPEQKYESILSALERVVERMQSRLCNSTDQLASRIIAALTLKSLKGETTFASCCDDTTREDVCQLTKLNAENYGWPRWVNQLNAIQDPYDTQFPRIQAALAFSLADRAGLTVESMAFRALAERLEYFDNSYGIKEPSLSKNNLLAHYAWAQTIDGAKGDQADYDGWLSAQIRSANEKLLQAHTIDVLDAQTAAVVALTSKRVGIYPNLKESLNKHLTALCESGPVTEKYGKSDIELMHVSDTVSNAWLLNACCALNLGSAESKKRLANYLLNEMDSDGWKNHVENAACILALQQAINSGVVSFKDTVPVRQHTPALVHKIVRTFEAADAKSKVWKDNEGLWHATRGSKFKTKIQIVCVEETRNLVLTDYVPAGALRVPKGIPDCMSSDMMDSQDIDFYNNQWLQHFAFDKNMAKGYALRIMPGVLNLEYQSRAVCPGKYTIPPARFDAVYNDRYKQVSAPDTLVIE